MRTQMKRVFPEAVLERILAGLERELIEASDEEILEAARELGMKPEMKGSAAFLGLRYLGRPRPEDFFDTELLRRLWCDPRRIGGLSPVLVTRPESPPATESKGPRRGPPRTGKPRRAPRVPKEPGES
jgi:hypothetical protein